MYVGGAQSGVDSEGTQLFAQALGPIPPLFAFLGVLSSGWIGLDRRSTVTCGYRLALGAERTESPREERI